MAARTRLQWAFPFQAFLATMILLFSPMDQADAGTRRLLTYQFDFNPHAPLADLLPTPPSGPIVFPPVGNTNWTKVPELTFGAPLAVKKDESSEKTMAHVIAKINHMSKENPDAFMRALIATRMDLRGLPFRMGMDCQTEPKQAWYFREIVQFIHANRFLDQPTSRPGMSPFKPNPEFWQKLTEKISNPDHSELDPWRLGNRDIIEQATVAALMQILGPGSPEDHLSLARFLGKLKHPDAGRALAKLALFTPERRVHVALLDALASHAAKDYEKTLLSGFHYPHPAVAKRAAETLVTMRNKEVLADLVQVLEQPDPRAPIQQAIQGTEATVINELVRVNHHRNCVLCHAPANVKGVPAGTLSAPVPMPDQELRSPSRGYYFDSSPDVFVRADVTYLRQDFSMMMKVNDAKPWPEMQRFDFLVHARKVTIEEAAARTKELAREPSPYHAAAQYALRELTGLEPADATPEGWRRVLTR